MIQSNDRWLNFIFIIHMTTPRKITSNSDTSYNLY